MQSQVWTTLSRIGGSHGNHGHGHNEYGIIFGSSLSEDYFIEKEETGFHTGHVLGFKGYPDFSILGVDPWPIQIDSSEKFGLYYTAPIITLSATEQQVALIGDITKWVPMSEQRVTNIINYSEFLLVNMEGTVGERLVFFYAYKARGDDEFKVSFVDIEFTASLRATLKISNGRPTVSYD